MASIRLQLAVSFSPLSRRVFTLQEVIEITLNVSNIAKTRIEFSQRTCFPLIANHWFSGFDYRLEWQSHPCEKCKNIDTDNVSSELREFEYHMILETSFTFAYLLTYAHNST